MIVLYSRALPVSAALLFLLEPMAGKFVLPLLRAGGLAHGPCDAKRQRATLRHAAPIASSPLRAFGTHQTSSSRAHLRSAGSG